MNKTNVVIFTELRKQLDVYANDSSRYCEKATDFTKAKKLPFVLTFCILINMIKKTLSLELYDSFRQLGENQVACTASAFSQARHKLKPSVFIDMNKTLLKLYYEKHGEGVKRWEGFRLEAVDGSSVNLPDNVFIRSYYGGQINQYDIAPMARVHARYDVLNELVIQSKISPYGISERELASRDLPYIANDVLSLFDRGYASFGLFYLFTNVFKREYVCRVSLSFNKVVKAFVESGKQSELVNFDATPTGIKFLEGQAINITKDAKVLVRLVRVELDNGEIEILATSLIDEASYPSSIFKELYNLRWGVETFFDYLKNKLQVEIFSGRSVRSIEQDFYAAIFTANVHSILINDCESIVQEQTKGRQGTYKINKNISLGLLKTVLVKLFLSPNFEPIIKEIQIEFCKHVVLSKKKETRPRKKRKRNINGKYVTLKNYKRAIQVIKIKITNTFYLLYIRLIKCLF